MLDRVNGHASDFVPKLALGRTLPGAQVCKMASNVLPQPAFGLASPPQEKTVLGTDMRAQVFIEYCIHNSINTTYKLEKYVEYAKRTEQLIIKCFRDTGILCPPRMLMNAELVSQRPKFQQPRCGAFEVTLRCPFCLPELLGHVEIWSKRKTHQWPNPERLADLVTRLMIAGQTGEAGTVVDLLQQIQTRDSVHDTMDPEMTLLMSPAKATKLRRPQSASAITGSALANAGSASAVSRGRPQSAPITRTALSNCLLQTPGLPQLTGNTGAVSTHSSSRPRSASAKARSASANTVAKPPDDSPTRRRGVADSGSKPKVRKARSTGALRTTSTTSPKRSQSQADQAANFYLNLYHTSLKDFRTEMGTRQKTMPGSPLAAAAESLSHGSTSPQSKYGFHLMRDALGNRTSKQQL